MPTHFKTVSLALVLLFGSLGVHAEKAPELPPSQPPEKPVVSEAPKKDPRTSPKARTVIAVTLKGVLAEHVTMPPLFMGQGKQTDLLSVFKTFHRAKEDPSVQGVLLRLGPLAVGWGKCQELRALMQEFRAAGKKIWVWLPLGMNRDYYVASAADEIVMPPVGVLLTMGLRAEVMYLKGTFDKIGVEAEIVHVGAYKSAGEPYTRTDMSPEFRETMESLLDEMMAAYVDGVSETRKLKGEEFKRLLAAGPWHAAKAKKSKLIDRVEYYEDLVEEIRKKNKVRIVSQSKYIGFGADRPDLSSLPGLLNFLGQLTAPPEGLGSASSKLALIYAVGPILSDGVPGGFPGGNRNIITAAPLVKAFKRARRDKTVKAVVFRVNSPGGDVITSDLIWKAVEETNRVKPVIVSMSDVAASGGYYISAPARAIVAYRTTLTGSIGVVGGKFNLKNLYGLIGANVEVVERGQGSGLFSPFHKLTDAERERMYLFLKESYDLFVQKAADGRKQKFEELEKSAQGRVWTGKQAKARGLIDETGGLRTALNLAKKHAGLKPEDKLELLILPRPKTLFDMLGGGMEDTRASAISARLLPSPVNLSFAPEIHLGLTLAQRHVLVYMPWRIEIK